MSGPTAQWSDRCQGIKADGKQCGMTRMSNWSKKSHLVTPEPWYCTHHKDQRADDDPRRCAGLNAKGQRCSLRQMDEPAKPLPQDGPWYCANHLGQAT